MEELQEKLRHANLAWVLPEWHRALILYKQIEETEDEHHKGHIAYRLGLLYKNGTKINDADTPVDPEKIESYFKTAKELVEKSASEGDCEALCDLGHMHENGNAGFSVNIPLATQYYRDAAEKGHPRGQYNLAVMLQQSGSIASAQHYYKLAAMKEYPCAQYNLACIFLREKDTKSALHFFAKAAQWGDKDAKYRLKKLFENTGPSHIEFLVEEWRHYYPKLHTSCQLGVLETVWVLEELHLLPELIQLISDEVIRAWPIAGYHFQH